MPIPKFLKNPPTKIIGVGLNYKDHAKEMNMKITDEPIIFLKPLTSLIGSEEKIILPEMSKRVDYEGELVIVIKDKAKNVSEEDALKFVEGFTCGNDVTARDLQSKDVQWTRAKGFDTFFPVGPRIVKGIDANNLKIQTFLNGQLRQESNTSQFIFSVEKLVSFVSKVMTLYPGDIITTGTPSGIGQMKSGDIVEVKIEKIGVLKNFVR